MISVTQMEDILTTSLQTQMEELARQTGFIQRSRKMTGADFVQIMAFGSLSEPNGTLDELTQVAQLRDVHISSSGLHQRFTPQAARFLQAVLERMVKQAVVGAAPVDIALLKRFSHVIVEDSSTIVLPSDLKDIWPGCGGGSEDGRKEHTEAALKLHVRWDLSTGALMGPRLTAGKVSDLSSPFNDEPLPAGSLSIRDKGYWSLKALREMQKNKVWFCARPKGRTVIMDRQGKRITLLTALPQRVGQYKVMRVRVGSEQPLDLRLLAIRVPEEVAEQRRQHLHESACQHGKPVSEEQLKLAAWTLILTNAPAKLIGGEEALIVMRARWSIELLFKLWKSESKIDEWRSHRPWKVLCEIYGKLIGVVIQHWFLLLGCWHDPYRSFFKAVSVVRKIATDCIEVLMGERSMQSVGRKVKKMMQSGCKVNHRATEPCLAQLLLEGLDWALT